MRIKVNNIAHQFGEDYLSINQLLRELKFTSPYIYVKIQDQVIEPKEFDQVLIKDNDEVSVFHFCCGG